MHARIGLTALALWGTALVPSGANAQDANGFKLSGSSRLRFEAIDGQARTGFDSADTLVNLRTQLLARYEGETIDLIAELYDSRVWGADPGTPVTTGEVNTFELVQAYLKADLGGLAGHGTAAAIQLGRFTLNLGSRRLVAADDYRNTTSGYTGLRADLAAPGSVKATLIYTLPQVRLPDDPTALRDGKVEFDRESFDQVLWGGLAGKPIGSLAPASPIVGEVGYFHFGERDSQGRPTRDRSLESVSLRVYAEPRPGRFDFEIEGIYQWGGISASLAPSAARLGVSASFVHAEVGYSLPGPAKPRLSLEFDRASGDGPGPSYGRFDTLFGMRRGELAPAGLYNAVGRANIVSPAVRLELAPSKRFDAFIAYRPLWLASRYDAFSTTGVRDAAGLSGNFAGHQVESRLRYWLKPDRLRFDVNGVFLAKGQFLLEAPNAPPSKTTRYVSFDLTAGF